MPTLHELQQAFSAALMTADPGAAGFVIGDGIAPEARLNIYRNTYLSNLVSALRISYPAVRKLVGDEFFEGVARSFIDGHRPKRAYLNDYGDALADFLAEFPPAVSLPYLADVARLEWAVNVALHCEDEPALDLTKLVSLREDTDPTFIAHPSASLVKAAYPADAIWRAVIAGDDTALSSINIADGPVFLVVSRATDGILVQRFTEHEWHFAQSLFAGMPLSLALTRVSTDMSLSMAAHFTAGRFADVQEKIST